MKAESVVIRPKTKRNGLTLTIVGCIGLCVGLALFISAKNLFMPGIVSFAFGAVAAVLGGAKLIEPEITLELTHEGFTYFHRRGSVKVMWENIQRMDIPKVTQGIDSISLPYIGIKVKKINPILDNIAPRLATGLLTEQRPLLMTASVQDEDLTTLENQMHTEFTPFVINDERYRGVLAMFGHRCQILDKHLGYHLFISIDGLDRSPEEFVRFMREFSGTALGPIVHQ